jgi:hypothetical protein
MDPWPAGSDDAGGERDVPSGTGQANGWRVGFPGGQGADANGVRRKKQSYLTNGMATAMS